MRTSIIVFLMLFLISCSSEKTTNDESLYEDENPILQRDYIDRVIDDDFKHGYYFIYNKASKHLDNIYLFDSNRVAGWVILREKDYSSSHEGYHRLISESEDSITVEVGYSRGCMGDVRVIIADWETFGIVQDTFAVLTPKDRYSPSRYTFSKQLDTLKYLLVDRVYADPKEDSVREYFDFPLGFEVPTSDLKK